MEPETSKTKPLSKEETKGLLSLIKGSKIINNKKTNATINKIKVEEWTRIAGVFNASMGTCRRTPQQLRLKWENLKKNSRKRSASIRMEHFKLSTVNVVQTGGGPPGYFPPDDILDRVAALLGSTGEGLTVRFGGDAEPQIIGDGSVETAFIVPVDNNISPMLLIDSPLPEKNPSSVFTEYPVSMGNEVPPNGIGDELVTLGNINTPIVPQEKRNFRTIAGVKRKLLKPDNGCQARNMALAEYYNLKRKMLENKNENLILQNEKLKLENEKLKLEIRKLKGEDF